MLLATVLIIVTTTAFGYQSGVASGRLIDTDAYSWATRAAELHSTGVWFDDTLDDVYPPTGLKQHWSRPFDVLLLAGGMVGAPLVGFSRALFGWAVALPVLLGVAAAWLLWWGFGDVLGAAGRDAFALLFALQPKIFAGFLAGRADHQALIGVVLVATLAVARRALRPTATTQQVALTGLLSAVGLWVGMEFTIVVAVLYTCLAYDWIRMRGGTATRIVVYSASLAAGSALALVVENGRRALVQRELDELSVIFVVGAVSFAVVAVALGTLSSRLATPRRRVGALLASIVVCGWALTNWFPAILGGPLGTVDPLYGSTRLASIAELQPLVGATPAWSTLVPSLSLIPFAVYGVARWRRDRVATDGWAPLRVLLVAAGIYGALALAQVRWLFALNLTLVVPAALGVQQLMHRAAPRATRVHLGMMGVAALAALWWLPSMFVTSSTVPPRCDTKDAVATLNDPDRVGAAPQRVMAFTDFGPEILFRTRHHVFSIPNHRPQPGYTATYDIMTSTDRSAARRALERHDADLLLVCSDERIQRFYGGDPASLHTALVSGDAPPWLTELPMPNSRPKFHLYRVDL